MENNHNCCRRRWVSMWKTWFSDKKQQSWWRTQRTAARLTPAVTTSRNGKMQSVGSGKKVSQGQRRVSTLVMADVE